MKQQQTLLFTTNPELLRLLCDGLAKGSSKEAEDCDHDMIGINIGFSRAISDDGLIRDITGAIANRLGCNPDEARASTVYNTGRPVVSMLVDVTPFEAE